MNYEELYQKLLPLEKKTGDKLAGALKNFRSLRKNTDAGDLKSFAKDLQALEENLREQTALLAAVRSASEAFDTKVYMESGDFSEQMEHELKQLSVDVKGNAPVYDVFPFKVRVDTDNQDVYVDKKRIQSVRPSSVAQIIKAGRDRLFRAGFNAADFVNELSNAYDIAVTYKNRSKPNAPKDSDIYLKDLYEYLAPMRRFRRDYDMQAYSFDLSRLCASECRTARDGRTLDFGTSRESKRMIRVLNENGHEIYLVTIRFFKRKEDDQADKSKLEGGRAN